MPDRYEHSREGAKVEDSELIDVHFYGWIRGCNFRLKNKIHIIGNERAKKKLKNQLI